MKKKFVSNLLLVLILNVIIKPFYILGIDAEVLKLTEQNDPGSYGTYFSLLSLSFIFNIILDMGVNTFNTRNIAQNSQLIQKHFSGIFTLKIFLSIIYLIVIIVFGIIFSYSIDNLKWLIIIGLNQILIAFILFIRSNLSALLMFSQDSFLSVTDRLLLIFFCGYFLWAKSTNQIVSIEFFILSQTLAYMITASVGFFMLYQKTRYFRFKWDLPFFLTIIKKSLPYALLIFLMSIYYYSDVVMIERIRGNVEAATYAHGYRFFMAFNMLGVLFAGLLLPIFSKLIKQNKEINSITWVAFKLIFLSSLIIAISIWFNKEEIIHWRYKISGVSLHNSSTTFGWLIISFIAVSFNYVFGTLLTAYGRLKPMNIIALFGVTVNVVLNIILIPNYGSIGAAFASMITQFFTLFAQLYLCYKFFLKNLKVSSYLPLIYFLLIFLLIIIYQESIEVFNWKIKLITCSLIGAILGFSFKIISIKDLINLLKTSKN